MEDIAILLRDYDDGIVNAWNKEFKEYPNFDISQGDIFNYKSADAIISPANSFGIMDGGIDLAYTKFFGEYLPKRLQDRISKIWDGELPVGCAEIVSIDREDFKYLISAPTMRVPQVIRFTCNAYLAFRAALRAVIKHNNECSYHIKSIICPGLGTLTGQLPASLCARQMRIAYDSVMNKKTLDFNEIMQEHYMMVK